MQTRRDFLRTIGIGSLALTSAPLLSCKGESPFKPNIIFILADDLGWSDLGCYGGEVATPNLDRLAEGGIRFTQFHNTAKCFPSRASLLTGLYAQQCGMDKRPNGMHNAVTLGEVLREAGYRTIMVGKHHGLENPYYRGFDHYYGLRDGAANYFNPGFQRPGEGVPAQKRPGERVWCFDEEIVQPFTPEESDFYSTDYYTNWALDFLEKYQAEDKPYFLYLAYQAPHDPLQAWPEDIDKYRGTYADGYEATAESRYEGQRVMGLIDETFPRSAPIHRDWQSLSQQQKADQALRMRVYAAMIDRMDQNIGRVLQKVTDLGEEQNTLIFFASDNGCSAEVVEIGQGEIGTMTRWASLGKDWANVSNTPFRYFKNYSHEGGICTPLIAYWPQVITTRGAVSHHVGHFIDIMPTVLDVASASYPEHYRGTRVYPYEGESILPILQGQKRPRQRPLFWQWRHGKAVMKDRWKLVAWGDRWELYDMEKDRTETIDLSAKYPEVVSELADLHNQWLQRVQT